MKTFKNRKSRKVEELEKLTKVVLVERALAVDDGYLFSGLIVPTNIIDTML